MMRLGLPGGSTRIQTLVPPVTKMRVRSDVLECRLGISLGFEPITEGHHLGAGDCRVPGATGEYPNFMVKKL